VIERKACFPFCCLRPPGHHVGRDGRTHDGTSQGFCFFNNVAIAAKYAVDRLGLQRVAVIDFDVHHGNGTEEILASDRRFFFVSTHTSDPTPWSCFRAGTTTGACLLCARPSWPHPHRVLRWRWVVAARNPRQNGWQGGASLPSSATRAMTIFGRDHAELMRSRSFGPKRQHW
jgi:hypothetical protein